VDDALLVAAVLGDVARRVWAGGRGRAVAESKYGLKVVLALP